MAKRRLDDPLSKKRFLVEWLEKLQQESWQLELLISGFALFGIYESRSWIDTFINHMLDQSYGPSDMYVGIVILLLKGGWAIFFINLLIHVVLRGLWIGAIGLRYVSQDIDYDSLGYNDQFSTYLRKKVGEYDEFIERLEKICSVLFAYTFLLFLLLLSLLLFLAFMGVLLHISSLGNKGEQPNEWSVMLIFVFLTLGLIVFIDFITLGALKRINFPRFSKAYMYLYRFFSTITLSFLYRPLLYNFIDDKYTRRLFYLSVPYIFLVIFADSIIGFSPYPHWSYDAANDQGLYISKLNYDDERLKWYDENSMKKELHSERLHAITLSQFMVDKPYLEIFLKAYGEDQFMLSQKDSIEPYFKPGLRFSLFSSSKADNEAIEKIDQERLTANKDLRDKKKDMRKSFSSGEIDRTTYTTAKDSLNKLIEEIDRHYEEVEKKYELERVDTIIKTTVGHFNLEIDGQTIEDELDCFKYRHPNLKERGILCLYPMDSLSIGRHMIEANRKRYRPNQDRISTRNYKIPFYKIAK